MGISQLSGHKASAGTYGVVLWSNESDRPRQQMERGHGSVKDGEHGEHQFFGSV